MNNHPTEENEIELEEQTFPEEAFEEHPEEILEQADEEAQFQAEIDRLTRERDDANDQMLRALADLQNVRRRAQQERQDLIRRASEGLVRELLPVLDSFDRALASAENGASVESLVEGLRILDRQLRQVLAMEKLERIDALGEPFDPERHEAIGTEVTDAYEEGVVALQVEAGYAFDGRVLRPARVKVAKAP